MAVLSIAICGGADAEDRRHFLLLKVPVIAQLLQAHPDLFLVHVQWSSERQGIGKSGSDSGNAGSVRSEGCWAGVDCYACGPIKWDEHRGSRKPDRIGDLDNNTTMATYWYQCRHCGTTIRKDSSPNSNGCPDSSSHAWSNLGTVGDSNYQCKKCGTTVQTRSTPNASGCPEASSHSWSKL